jgi:hypothetical protein
MAQSVAGRSSDFGELRIWDEHIRWRRGSEISARDRGPEPPGVSRTDFFLGPKKIGIRKWVFPVRDEKSNVLAEAVECQAIS